jgi:type I restriction-modification system DNA methylase subunit
MAGRRTNNGAILGFEQTLWQAADKMRGHMDPSEYKHVALGLIFLKYISDAFKERRKRVTRWRLGIQVDDLEDRLLSLSLCGGCGGR